MRKTVSSTPTARKCEWYFLDVMEKIPWKPQEVFCQIGLIQLTLNVSKIG